MDPGIIAGTSTVAVILAVICCVESVKSCSNERLAAAGSGCASALACCAARAPAGIAVLSPMGAAPNAGAGAGSNVVDVLMLAANTVTNNPMGITLVATQPVANAINHAANPNRTNSTTRGGTRRKERRSKRRQQGGVRTMTVEILQGIFNEVMDTVRPIFTGTNFEEISLRIQEIVLKHVQV